MLPICLQAAGDLSLRRVVIDAGHGGKDPGAVSQDRRTYEKTLTLDIAKRLGKKISEGCPGVSVTYTRSSDVFVSLNDRAVIANRANADLFISIHINASRATSANGFSLHVLGQSSIRDRDLYAYNMDVCKRENSVILLEDDYSTTYQGFDPSDPESFIFMQLMQNSHLEQSLLLSQMISSKLSGGPVRVNRGVWQNPFYVLWKTAMPSVLVELGFISNSADLSVLKDPEKRDRIADALFSAFLEYKQHYDSSVDVGARESVPAPAVPEKAPAAPLDTVPATTAAPVPSPAPAQADVPSPSAPTVLYGSQIFALRTLLPENDSRFLGFKPRVVKVGEIYRYFIGVYDSIDRAKEEFSTIRKKYPSAFISKIEDAPKPDSANSESAK